MTTRTPLGNLIQASLDAHGWSARQIEDLSGGAPGLGRQNISLLMNKPLTSIKGETLVSLADVLGLPTELVVRAALRSLKTPIELTQETGSVEDVVRIDPDLSETDKQTLLRLLMVMRAEAGETRSNTAPMKQAGKKPAQPDYEPGPDEAIGPGEAGYLAPPENYEYDLAADESLSEGRRLRLQGKEDENSTNPSRSTRERP
ncbi:hypothetical protein ACIGDM_10485 [Rothia koreensis]|uniref:hypothetical protein n=1 Tax=Rothia koreensis TaxID=592378 RepID=UPI0037C6E524